MTRVELMNREARYQLLCWLLHPVFRALDALLRWRERIYKRKQDAKDAVVVSFWRGWTFPGIPATWLPSDWYHKTVNGMRNFLSKADGDGS
jgi:hypothetical protein